VPPTLEDGLRALREATEQASKIRIDLDERYLRAIALAEALPTNQSGTDKAWVWNVVYESARHFARAIRKR
jgi:hypothetical protein